MAAGFASGAGGSWSRDLAARHGVGDSEKVLNCDWQAGEANSFHSPRPFIFPTGHVCLDDSQIVFTHRRFWAKASCKITCHDLFVMLIRGCMTIISVDRHDSFGSLDGFRPLPGKPLHIAVHAAYMQLRQDRELVWGKVLKREITITENLPPIHMEPDRGVLENHSPCKGTPVRFHVKRVGE